jgi:C4-dicarboxylate transporter DctM subunit
VARATGLRTEQVFRGVLPFVLAMLVLVLTIAPGLVLWLPETMGS